MAMYRLLFLYLIFTLFSKNINAQDKWSLNECIQYAFEHNLDIKQKQVDISVADYNLKQSRYDLLPNLNAGFSYSYNTGRYFDQVSAEILAENTNNLGVGINSSVDIFNGLRKHYQQKYYEVNHRIYTTNLEKSKNDISITIATAYLDILYSQELSELAKQQLELIQQQVDKTQKQVDAGNVANGELLEIKAQEANEKLQVTNANNNLEIAILNLVQLLDLDSIADFQIQQPELNIDLEYHVKPFNEIYEEALLAMPQIKGAELAIDASKFQEEINKSYYYPRVDMSYNFNTYYSDNLTLPNINDYGIYDQWKDNRGSAFRVGLNIPIFNKMQVNTNVALSKIQTKKAEFDMEQTKLNLYKEIQQAQLDLKSYYSSFLSAKEAVEYNKQAFNYTLQKLEVGLIDAVTYNTAKNNLRESEVMLLQAKYQYVFQLKLLDFYTGKPILFD